MKQIILAIFIIILANQLLQASQNSSKIEKFREEQRKLIQAQTFKEQGTYDKCFMDAYRKFVQMDPQTRLKIIGGNLVGYELCERNGYRSAAKNLGIKEPASIPNR